MNREETSRRQPPRAESGAWLTAYALDELGGAEAECVERQFEADPAALREVEAILETASLLQSELAREPELFLTAEQREAVLSGRPIARRVRPIVPAAAGRDLALAMDRVPRPGTRLGRTLSRTRAPIRRRGPSGSRRASRRQARGWVAAVSGAAAVAVALSWWATGDRSGNAIGGTLVNLVERGHSILHAIRGGHSGFAGKGSGSELPDGAADPGEIELLWAGHDGPRSSPLIEYDIPSFEQVVAAIEADRTLSSAGGAARLDAPSDGEEVAVAVGGSEMGGFEPSGVWVTDRRLPNREIPPGLSTVPSWIDPVVRRREGPDLLATGFQLPLDHPVSQVSLLTDPTRYSDLRHFVTSYLALPPAERVSVVDLVNSFEYGYQAPAPDAEHPVAVSTTVADCPWAPDHRLVRVVLKASETAAAPSPKDVVFVVDASASMRAATKLPVVLAEMGSLIEALPEGSRVAAVAFGGSPGFVLEPTPVADRQRLESAFGYLAATAGSRRGRTFELAVSEARRFYGREGRPTVAVVVTDSLAPRVAGGRSLVAEVEPLRDAARDGVRFVAVGRDVLRESWASIVEPRDAFAYAGSSLEARRILCRVARTVPGAVVAPEVGLEVEFNPMNVRAYRLVTGSNDLALRGSDGLGRWSGGDLEAGSEPVLRASLAPGEERTLLYEIVPALGDAAATLAVRAAEPLRYERFSIDLAASTSKLPGEDELLTVRVDHGVPDSEGARGRIEVPVRVAEAIDWEKAPDDFRFATAVAAFGMLLADKTHLGPLDLAMVESLAEGSVGGDPLGLRREFVELVRVSRSLVE